MKVDDLVKGLFCGIRFDDDTVDAILKFVEENDIPKPVSKDDIHCTILYSRKPVIDFAPLGDDVPDWEIEFKGYDLFGEDNNILVMTLDSPDLVRHHKELMDEYKASWDWPEYQPHITLSYSAKGIELDELPDYRGPLIAVNEYAEELDEEWEKNDE